MISRSTVRRGARCASVALLAFTVLVPGCGPPNDEALLRFLGFKQSSTTISVLEDNLREASTVTVDAEFENDSLYVGQKTGTGILVNQAHIDYRMARFSPPSADYPLNLYLPAPADSKATTGTLTSFPLAPASLKQWIIDTGAFGDPGIVELTAHVTFHGVTDEGAVLQTEGSIRIALTNTGATSTSGTLPTVTVSRTADAIISGDPGAFAVTRTGSVAAPLTVGFTTVGSTAISGIDYTAIGSSVVIPAGSSSGTITVTARPAATSGRIVKVTLSPSVSYTVGAPDSASLTIN